MNLTMGLQILAQFRLLRILLFQEVSMGCPRLIAAVVPLFLFVLFLAGCKADEATAPVDTPPAVTTLAVRSIGVRTSLFTFTITDSDSPLDSALMLFGDGSTEYLVRAGGKKDVVDSVSHVYALGGAYTAMLKAFSKGKEGVKDITVAIGDQPPTINIISLTGTEGKTTTTPLSTIATDPEGDPFTVEVTSQHPNLIAQITQPNLQYRGIDSSTNGTYQLKIKLTDPKNRTVEKTIPVNIQPMDDITGKIQDILEGTYLAARRPNLVIQPPYTGWIKIDGIQLPITPQGNYTSPKLTPQNHTIESFITNGTDSSFIATDTISPGDQTFNPKVHTNTGTQLTLALLRDFYLLTNFGNYMNLLGGFDFTNATSQRFWLSGKDTLNWRGQTPNQQQALETIIANDWLEELAPNKRPAIYKAQQGESIPFFHTPRGPAPGYGLIFIDNSSGANGTFAPYSNPTNPPHIERCIITLSNADQQVPPYYGFNRATVNQETGSWLCNPTRQLGHPDLEGKTIFHDRLSGVTTPTAIDLKLLYLVVQIPIGTHINKYWKLP